MKQKIDLLVPPDVEKTFGYEGEANWVGFWWSAAGDELAWMDGREMVIGANWTAWLSFIRHPKIALFIGIWDFGSSDDFGDPKHMLILNREEREFWGFDFNEGEKFLRSQWPVVEKEGNIFDQFTQEELVEAFNVAMEKWNDQMEEINIQELMKEQREKENAMIEWLNEQTIKVRVKCENCGEMVAVEWPGVAQCPRCGWREKT